jgi:hypothetical protein
VEWAQTHRHDFSESAHHHEVPRVRSVDFSSLLVDTVLIGRLPLQLDQLHDGRHGREGWQDAKCRSVKEQNCEGTG